MDSRITNAVEDLYQSPLFNLVGMNNESPLMGPTNGLFSPADFGDAEDLRPTAAIFDIGGNGSLTPYTTATNAILSKHIDEIKQKTAAALTMPSGWKKRLRDFLAQKNTQLLDFLAVNVNSHPTLGKGGDNSQEIWESICPDESQSPQCARRRSRLVRS